MLQITLSSRVATVVIEPTLLRIARIACYCMPCRVCKPAEGLHKRLDCVAEDDSLCFRALPYLDRVNELICSKWQRVCTPVVFLLLTPAAR